MTRQSCGVGVGAAGPAKSRFKTFDLVPVLCSVDWMDILTAD
jgi:hypothetical protein